MPNLDLNEVFTYHKPTTEQAERYTRLREAAKAYAEIVVELTPSSREQSIALTHIQTASMFANAAIAINEEEAP